jgi:hypothetical protein
VQNAAVSAMTAVAPEETIGSDPRFFGPCSTAADKLFAFLSTILLEYTNFRNLVNLL